MVLAEAFAAATVEKASDLAAAAAKRTLPAFDRNMLIQPVFYANNDMQAQIGNK